MMMGMMMRMIIGRVNEINSSPGMFGSMNHYDENGKKIGHSSPGMFGSTNHYDAHGNKVGRSSSGFFGSKNHYDDHGRKTVNLLLINN